MVSAGSNLVLRPKDLQERSADGAIDHALKLDRVRRHADRFGRSFDVTLRLARRPSCALGIHVSPGLLLGVMAHAPRASCGLTLTPLSRELADTFAGQSSLLGLKTPP